MNKKLNLFLLENKNKIQNKNMYPKNNLNINYVKYFDIVYHKEYLALSRLVKCMSLLHKFKKTILIFTNNHVTILYRNNFYNKLITYKFDNIEIDYLYKIFTFTQVAVFVNASASYIKFKSDFGKNIEFSLTCFPNNIPAKKIYKLINKMYVLAVYFIM